MKSWKEVRAEAIASGTITEPGIEQARREIDEHIRAWRLADLRRRAEMTQTEVAEAMGVKQPWVSKIEGGNLDHVEVETLRSYATALGSTLKVVFDFGDEQHVIV